MLAVASSDQDDVSQAILPVSYPSVDKDETGIWRELLASKKIDSNQGSTLIVLGDKKSGKRCLLTKLNKSEKKNHAETVLEYRVIKVQNDARDSSYAYQLGTAGANLNPSEMLNIPVWNLDGNGSIDLLKHSLPKSPLKTIFVLAASIDNPNLIHSLKRWANVAIEQSQKKFDKQELKEGREQQERLWKEYVDPAESQMSTSVVGNFGDDHNLLPLDQGTLTENIGVTFIVVVTKADLAKDIQDQQFAKSMIQLRKFCLTLGASLIFTSAKDNKNVQLLQKYVLHRSFGTPFTNTAQVIERDGIFVPAGWDSEKRIDIMRETIPDIDTTLEPTREKIRIQPKEVLIEADDDQEFLKKLSDVLNSTNAPIRKVQNEDPVDKDSPLANFFSNLLKDKPGRTSATPPISQDQTAAQLDRFLKSATPAKSNSDVSNA